MFCKNCGTQNPDEAAFCKNCGTPLQAAEAAPNATPQQQATQAEQTITPLQSATQQQSAQAQQTTTQQQSAQAQQTTTQQQSAQAQQTTTQQQSAQATTSAPGKKKFPVVPVAVAAVVILFIAIISSGGDSGSSKNTSNNSKTNNSKPATATPVPTTKPATATPVPTLTAAEKKAWVEKNVPGVKNDFRSFLPYTDIMHLSLANVKNAVAKSTSYSEETSIHTDFSKLSLYTTPDTIAFRFSTRTFNLTDKDSDSLLEYFLGGLVNGIDASTEAATYYFIVTDNSSNRLVNMVYIIYTHHNNNFQETKASFSNKFSDGKTEGNCIRYTGLISEPNYTEIYDYCNGLSTKYPSCIGNLCLYDNTSESNGNSILLQISY